MEAFELKDKIIYFILKKKFRHLVHLIFKKV